MYYKAIFITVFLLAIIRGGYGQTAEADNYWDHSKLDPAGLSFMNLDIKAQRVAPGSLKLPFGSVRIIDSRFDTTKFGFIRPKAPFFVSSINMFHKLRFRGGVALPLQEYYNDYYSDVFTDNGFELLIVMKRFWVSGKNNEKGRQMDKSNREETDLKLHLKWEYYLGRNNSYLPVKRVDTVLHFIHLPGRDVEEEFSESKLANLKFFLKGLIEIYDFNAALRAYDSNARKTAEQIDTYNRSRFNIPVLQDSVIRKGVYLSYEEFKNNRPSITEYKEKKIRYNIYTRAGLYLEDMKGNAINDYWGYSDGASFRFSKYGHKKMFRTGNTFELFMETVSLTQSPETGSGGSPKELIPYQLDMETGKIY